MTAKMLEKVLNCPTLPSLPGVAISMLELLRQPSCTADKVAELIQNDPALASKVLKTVNSSYYGLSKPCPTISRAVAFLGMNTVKSLTLGLSLVDVGRSTDSGFDLVAYWRRSVYGAAAARIIARLSRCCDPDEVFIATLLQDVGMLACYAALGPQYASLMSTAADHESLARVEQDQLGFDHAEAGAQMAEKWRLPEQIVACTRYHHRPDIAPQAHAAIVRVVGASSEAAASLVTADPQPRLVAFRRRMREWFNVDGLGADELLHQTGSAAKELSKLLELDTGASPDVSAILAEASEQLVHHQVEMDRKQLELARQSVTDALTGAFNRKHFDAVIAPAFAEASASGNPLSVLFADADKFKSINDTLGHQAGDAVLVEISRRLRERVGESGSVCRYGGEEFAVVLSGVTLEQAREVAEQIRRSIEERPIDIGHLGLSTRDIRQTISVGVSCTVGTDEKFATWEALVHAADEAVYMAKKLGRNRVCCAGDRAQPVETPAAKAATPAITLTEPAGPGVTAAPTQPVKAATVNPGGEALTVVLIVEDDALSAKMLDVLLTRHGRFKTYVARSAEDALRMLHGGRSETPLRPQLVLVDINLPSMSGPEFIRACRASQALRDLRFVMLSASADAHRRREAADNGVLGFIDKTEMCLDISGTLRRISDCAAARAA